MLLTNLPIVTIITPVSSNMAMENTLFIGDFPIEPHISSEFPTATFDYDRVTMENDCFLR